MWDKKLIEKLDEKIELSKLGGGEQRIAKQHAYHVVTEYSLFFDKMI